MNRFEHTATAPRGAFWKIAGAGAGFQAGSAAVDSATVVASLVYQLTGNLYAVGAASAVVRLGWLLPQILVGYLAERSARRMPFYIVGAYGRAIALVLIALVLWFGGGLPLPVLGAAFLVLWSLYSFVSGIVAVPYNDIVARSIAGPRRSRMLAWRFFGGGLLALGVAAIVHRLLAALPLLGANAAIFALAAVLMLVSASLFVAAGEPPLGRARTAAPDGFRRFLCGGLEVLKGDRRFRLFLYSQWLGGATFMALPFYVVAASGSGVAGSDVAILLGAQTAGALASNGLWGLIGDRHGKLHLLLAVGMLRVVPPGAALALLAFDIGPGLALAAFTALFVALGMLVNGMTIGYLGFLMEISPNRRRPAYSAYFNSLAAPAALLPLAGAALVEALSMAAVFAAAGLAALAQLAVLWRIARLEMDNVDRRAPPA